jgi:hypothetical protein
MNTRVHKLRALSQRTGRDIYKGAQTLTLALMCRNTLAIKAIARTVLEYFSNELEGMQANLTKF